MKGKGPLVVLAVGMVTLFAVRRLHPTGVISVTCPSVAILGLYCPLCGGTRAVHALSTGDLPAMAGYNALVPILLILGAWAWGSWAAREFERPIIPPIPRPRLVFWSVGALALIYGAARNLPWEPFTALAP